MLDDEEFQAAMSKHVKGVPKGDPKAEFAPVLEEYQRITGFRETNFLALWHHRASLYGPPCSKCGKPLRTPQAKLCGSCMHPVTATA